MPEVIKDQTVKFQSIKWEGKTGTVVNAPKVCDIEVVLRERGYIYGYVRHKLGHISRVKQFKAGEDWCPVIGMMYWPKV